MKLNTNKIFTSSKPSKHVTNKNLKTYGMNLTKSTRLNQSNKETTNNTKKSTTNSPKKNPFNNKLMRTTRPKNPMYKKIKSSKEQNIYFHGSKKEEVSDFCEALKVDESNKEEEEEKEPDIETLCKMFHSSKLNRAIVMDNNGNNNLNPEQKKLFDDYFDKKKSLEKKINNCKINTIKVQSYNQNNIHLKEKEDTKNNGSFIKFKKLNLNLVPSSLISKKREGRITARKTFLSSKQNKTFKNLFEFKVNKDIEEEDKENNSMFENCSNKSFDSSFLGSSMAEDFLENLN